MADYDDDWQHPSQKKPEQKKNKGCCDTKCGRVVKSNLLLVFLVLSLVLGILLGAMLKMYGPEFTTREKIYFRFPGDLLMRMLKCLIIPLITSSLIAGLAGLETGASGKMGLYAVVYYLITTFLAVLLGILLVMTIKPGAKVGKDVEVSGDKDAGNIADSFLDLIRNLFPDNVVEACFRQTKTRQIPRFDNVTTVVNDTGNSTTCMDLIGQMSCNVTELDVVDYTPLTQKEYGMNVLGLVVFSIALGIVTSKLGEVGRPLYMFANSLAEATMLLVTAVIWYSPIGILFLVASEIINMQDPIAELEALGLYMATVVIGLLIHGFVVLPIIYLAFVKSNPFSYLAGALQALLTALGTASSSATLPVTYRCLEENNHIDPRVTRFVLPVGATINMDGTALYEAVAAIFIAQSLGMDLSAVNVVTISLTATLASVGAASVPQAGLVTMIIVLTAVGIDADQVTKILAVDWLLDRVRTMINVWGDSVGAAIVYKHSKVLLDKIDADAKDTHDNTVSPHMEAHDVENWDRKMSPPYGVANGGYQPYYQDYMDSTKF